MLEIRDFSKTYKGGKRAVDHLSLRVEPGSIVGFIGPNGAGKTTTIRAVVGVLDFSEGDIFVGGHSVRREPIECKKLLAYVPDNPDLYDYLTGMQYLNFMADVFGVSAEDREARIREYGELFGLTINLGDSIGSFSHGMKQKLALMGALIHDPKLLILDEPFVGLDPVAAHAFKEQMRALCDRGGAVFFSTHVLDVAEKLCDKVAIIKNGRLAAFGDTDAVRGDGSLEELFLELVKNEEALCFDAARPLRTPGHQPPHARSRPAPWRQVAARAHCPRRHRRRGRGLRLLHGHCLRAFRHRRARGLSGDARLRLGAGGADHHHRQSPGRSLWHARSGHAFVPAHPHAHGGHGARLEDLQHEPSVHAADPRPGGVAYGILAAPAPAPAFYISYALCALAAPMLPAVVASLLGALVALAGASIKRLRYAGLFLMFVALIGVVVGSSYLSSTAANEEMFIDFAKGFSDLFARIYPLAGLYEKAVLGGDAVALLAYVGLSLLAILLAGALFGRFFVRLNSFLTARTGKKRFVLGAQKQRSARAALLAREWRHFLSINSYVLNSAFGPILSLVAVIALAVLVPKETIDMFLQVEGLDDIALSALPFALSWLIAIGPTTACSVSLEGKNLWIVKTLPIPAREWLLPKLRLNLQLFTPLCHPRFSGRRLDLPRKRRGAGSAGFDAGADGRFLGARRTHRQLQVPAL